MLYTPFLSSLAHPTSPTLSKATQTKTHARGVVTQTDNFEDININSSKINMALSSSSEILSDVDVNLTKSTKTKLIINFADIEAVTPNFKGENHENVTAGFENFESHAQLFGL